MFKSILKKTIAIVLVFAMIMDVSTALAYAIGSDAGSRKDNRTDIKAIINDRTYDPDRPLQQERSGVYLDKEVAEVVNNTSDPELLEANNDTVLFEKTDKRDVNVKSYSLTDGSNVSLLYPITVHEKDAEGKWVEIDNLLKEALAKDGERVFEAQNELATTQLYATPQFGKTLEISTKFGRIGWGINADGARSEGTYKDPELKKGYEKLQIKSISGILTYKDVFDGVDLNYQLLGHNVEEAVVINTPEAAERIAAEGLSYTLSLEGYRAELKDNSVYLYAEGAAEPEYVISAPYMEDAAQEESGEIELRLKEGQEGYILTVLPGSEWFLSEERTYPIVIDPTITQYADITHLDTCTVYSKTPTSNLYNYGNLMLGKEASAYLKMRALVRFDLPASMTITDVVVDATLLLTQRGYEPTNSPYHVYADVHKITSNISMSSATWNLLNGNYDSTRVIENRATDKNTNSTTFAFDITSLVKDWQQNGNNYGLALLSHNENGGSRYVKFYSAHFTGVSQSLLPTVSITYVDQAGLESYLSYHNAGTSTMGTVSVSDANGNLIYAYDDISLSGEYMPLSIQHVYDHAKRTNADLAGTAMHYGAGFRLNLSQKIESTSITGYPYKYIDADGTAHLFKLKSGTTGATGSVYEKEFETTTTLTKTSSGYTLDFSGDLVYYFNTSGLLTSITDTSNNKTMTLSYSSNRLTTVTDGAGRAATLAYNSSGYLTSITDPAGRSTSYTYSSNRLTQITEPDGSAIKFAYTAGSDSTQMLTKITDIDNSYLSIEYYTNAPYRVKSITEYGSSGGAGGKLSWTYSGGETTITDRDGLTQTMLFDRAGHTVSVRDSEGNAYFGSYKNTNDNNKHSLYLSSDLQGTIRNYLVNHNFEQSSASPWAVYSSSGSGSISLNTSNHFIGSKSLYINSSSGSGEYGTSQEFTAESLAGKDVTFSAYVNIQSISAGSVSTAGLVLEVAYKNSSGNWVTSRSVPIKATTDGWKRLAHSVSIPSSAQSAVRVRVIFVSASGTAYIDCAQLETGAVANRYNLVENGWFKEAAGSTSVSDWTGEILSTSTDKVAAGRDGRGFSITGDPDEPYHKALVQTVPVSGSIGDSYAYGAWAKAAAVGPTDKNDNTSRDFAVALRFVQSNGTYETVKTTFDALTTGWQYVAGTAVAPCNYTSIQIVLCYFNQKNTVVFDDVQLHRTGFGTVYTYDTAGRVLTETDALGRKTSFTYYFNNRPEVSTVTHPDGTVSTYSYDSSTHKLLSQTDTNGNVANYTYDSSWNNTKVYMTVDNISLSSGVKQFGTAGYVASETDPFGNTTQYAYNANKGLLTSVTEPNSAVTSYSYNANNDLLTGVTKGASSVSYSYTNRRLTGLSHSGGGTVSYGLTYDQFGNRTAVKVGTQNLSSNTYASYNGLLTQTTYGNGTYTEPIYDSLKRQTGLKVNGTQKYRWHYGADGKIGVEEDLASGVTWRYLYDSEDNLSFASGTNGDLYSNFYNASGKLSETSIVTGGSEIRNVYTYNTGNGFLDEMDYFDGSSTVGWTKYWIDPYERAKIISVSPSHIAIFSDIWYRTASDGVSETMLPEDVIYNIYVDEDEASGTTEFFRYSYDSMGNISSVERSSDGENYSAYVSYVYDSYNQLVRENNAPAGKTWVYTYDSGGNITQAKEYVYTTGTPGTATATRNYTYGDSNWKDKLTGYNGTTFTYDSIGNPLAYRDGMSFTWQNGRQLSSVIKSGTTTSYSYNSSGIRTSKTVGTTTTNYTLNGSRVVKETTGSNSVLYYYDVYGSPVAFRVKNGSTNTDYYYYKNVQGDITAIVDSAGQKVVEYTYDAWGKVLSTTGSLASTIGQSNPYRYRGYWYDSETGLYYLQSRYYDPQTGRFINADGFVSTGQGVLSCNMFAYCENNPVCRVDAQGYFWTEILEFIQDVAGAVSQAINSMSYSYAACGALAVADGPAPFGDAVAVLGVVALTLGAVGYGIYNTVKTRSESTSKTKTEELVDSSPSSTRIYRYGGTNPGNLTPKAKDLRDDKGLSFSTVPMPGAAMTTIEALNATNKVYAVKDGPTHVSVYPIGGTMADWVNEGVDSIWTKAVKSVVVKWDGIK